MPEVAALRWLEAVSSSTLSLLAHATDLGKGECEAIAVAHEQPPVAGPAHPGRRARAASRGSARRRLHGHARRPAQGKVRRAPPPRRSPRRPKWDLVAEVWDGSSSYGTICVWSPVETRCFVDGVWEAPRAMLRDPYEPAACEPVVVTESSEVWSGYTYGATADGALVGVQDQAGGSAVCRTLSVPQGAPLGVSTWFCMDATNPYVVTEAAVFAECSCWME